MQDARRPGATTIPIPTIATATEPTTTPASATEPSGKYMIEARGNPIGAVSSTFSPASTSSSAAAHAANIARL